MNTSAAGRSWVAPTYLLTDIPSFVDSITYRMLADGMILQDIRAARENVHSWPDWLPFWTDRALAHEKLGDTALDAGYRVSAAAHLVRASLCAHYGQFLSFDFPREKQAAVELKSRLYRRAAPHMAPPAEPVEFAYGDSSLPGFVRRPIGSASAPVVVHIGGLDAAKEDAHQFSELCLARGLAVVTFDGPGQGEAFYRGFLMDGRFHEAVSAVIDVVSTMTGIDAGRLAVIGRSTGGFLAPKSTAEDNRIKACCVWGAMYDLHNFDEMPPLIIDGFQFVTASKDWDEAEHNMRWVNLAGVAERITVPLYVLHGGKDNITPPWNAERMIAEAKGPTTLRLYPNSIHCNHDVAHVARPEMADWLAATLGAVTPGAGLADDSGHSRVA
jgi:2,6-dihydroxypseudooxynicotine hydrolase